jgi:hypothetical protein
MEEALTLASAEWWVEWATAPEHADALYVAKRVLPQPTAMTAAERDWKTYDYVHTKLRNRLTPERAADLVYVYSHLQWQESVHR